MKYRIDEDEAVLHLDLNSDATAEKTVGHLQAVIEHRPELRGWDWIIDARVLPQDLSVEHVGRLSEAYRASDEQKACKRAVVALISEDRNLFLWAQVMDHQFPGRRHQVVADLDAAHALIARDRTART